MVLRKEMGPQIDKKDKLVNFSLYELGDKFSTFRRAVLYAIGFGLSWFLASTLMSQASAVIFLHTT